MARKTLKIILKDRGVDKKFFITETSAADTEEWALRAFLAMAAAGAEVPDDVAELGFAGIMQTALSSLGKISYEAAKPLLDKLMECVQIVPDFDDERVMRPLVDSDIEDAKNRLILRREVFKLHADF